MRLSEIVDRFEPALLEQYDSRLSSDMRRALRCWRHCRSENLPQLDCRCEACSAQALLPQACGHRACPHCQHDVGADWLDQQRRLRLPVDYFLLTFTLPAQLRGLARRHPREVYAALMQCAWQTLAQFARNGRSVELGATAVLHTHSRSRDYHPHVHLVVTGGGLNLDSGKWKAKRRYLFNSQNLARVFRAKLLQRLRGLGLSAPPDTPKDWVAHCACVGDGDHALAYLARYLYRGVLSETDMLGIEGDNVRFRYRDARTGELRTRWLPGADFLWLLLAHVLPRGFRRCRSYGLLHHRRTPLLQRVQLMLRVVLPPTEPRSRRPLLCKHCGQPMRIRPAPLTRPRIESVGHSTPAAGPSAV
jgi:hypothetical protein